EDYTRIAVRRRAANLADLAFIRESLDTHQLAYFESRFRHRRFRIAQVCARTIVQVLAVPQDEGEQKQNVAADVGQVWAQRLFIVQFTAGRLERVPKRCGVG